jgi:beta-glucosidase
MNFLVMVCFLLGLQYLRAPLDAIQERAIKDDTKIYTSTTDNPSAGASAAQSASTAIVFINSVSGEEYVDVKFANILKGDRVNLDPWNNGNELVAAVARVGKPTIVVIHSVGPIILEEILATPNVMAIVWAGLPAQESGIALVDILYGDVSPSGKLPYTIAKRATDYGTTILKGKVDPFSEKLHVDYRRFDEFGIEPRYEFGFGLCKILSSLISDQNR